MNHLKEPKSTGTFRPRRVVRHPLLQSAISNVRSGRTGWIEKAERLVVIDGGPDHSGQNKDGRRVRLHGYYTPAIRDLSSDGKFASQVASRRGLAIALHGWEGSSHSTYNLVLTDGLARAGFDVFRLNMRDHGPNKHLNTYALNRGLFFATLLDEVITAVRHVSEMANGMPIYLLGASLGGNFVLRMAAHPEIYALPNLRKVVAVSPAICPVHSIDAIDTHPLYLAYFRHGWFRSLRAKESLFPEYYDFRKLWTLFSLRAMTEWLMERYGPYSSADEYFKHYAVSGELLQNLSVPTSIIAAKDDRVVPIDDFKRLPERSQLSVQIFETGGHVGFVDIFPFRHYLPAVILECLSTGDDD